MHESEALTSQKARKVIDDVCSRMNGISGLAWSFEAASSDQLKAVAQSNVPTIDTIYGIVAKEKGTTTSQHMSLTTFFLAYSTWDGRVMFRDYCSADNDTLSDKNAFPVSLWYYVLANVAVGLKCARLVWSHFKDEDCFPSNETKVERLDGWLTLTWSLAAMKKFGGIHAAESTSTGATDLGSAFESALKQPSASEGKFRLRLARTAEDINDISRLVHGLAEYEKEPESVNIGSDQLQLDSINAKDMPLFYCIMIDSITDNHTCGMAFCYVGFRLQTGRFLYLEDLFFERAYRGKGGGTIVMKALARVAQSLDASCMKWQALDWNAPALGFYSNIGATVDKGLQTSRISGQLLVDFARSAPPGS